MSADDDNLADLREARDAILDAIEALKGGKDQPRWQRKHREIFVFKVGFARGKLSRVSERIYKAGENAT